MIQLIFEANEENFEAQVLKSTVPVLIEFTADWCPPCKMLAPIIDAIAHKYEGKLHVGMINSDDNPKVVQDYAVMGLPTLILFVDGIPVERITGFKPQERIEAKLLSYLVIEDV